ncbi:MAG: hypothetical protein DCF17_18325, partial [Shackletoniella antarctica]
APPSTTAAVDLTVLRDFADTVGGGSPDFLAEIMLSYLDSTDQLLADMATAYCQQDWLTLKRAAHTLKSSSATVSATDLASLCQALETALGIDIDADVNTELSQAIGAKVEAIQRVSAQVKAVLQSALGSQEVTGHVYSA